MYKFFNAAHAPSGAFSSFTIGKKGTSGGMGINLGKPADKKIYIGFGCNNYNMLPFYTQEEVKQQIEDFTEEKTFDVSSISHSHYVDSEISREYKLGTDTFITPDFQFQINTPNFAIKEDILNICPSITIEVEVTNRESYAQNFVFAFERHSERGSFYHYDNEGICAIVDNSEIALSTCDSQTKSVNHFSIEDLLNKSWLNSPNCNQFMLAELGGLVTEVPANTTKKINYVISFYQQGIVTSNIRSSLYYTKYFKMIDDVIKFSHKNFEQFSLESKNQDKLWNSFELSDDEKFQIAHSIHSYFASSQYLLSENGEGIYIVNEGEYRMMNTLDLVIDHMFFELDKHPDMIKKQLEFYYKYYSYTDQVKLEEGKLGDGGISFCHDVGNINQFGKFGNSSYELTNLSGCFSYMTYEQLTNYVIVFSTYILKTKDYSYLKANKDRIDTFISSFLNRDHPNIENRNGIMGCDSSKVGTGDEITTYDSLDISLGQARNNTYLASKTYASYCLLRELQLLLGLDTIELDNQIDLLINTITAEVKNSKLTAVLFEDNNSYIIPVGEGLVYLKYLGLEKYLDNKYIDILKTHTLEILNPKYCLYENGGYKLSSTSDMTWLSKIYLSMYVHNNVFEIDKKIIDKANKVAVEWLMDEELSYWAWSDQILGQKIKGSKYYPRGVTSYIWTNKNIE